MVSEHRQPRPRGFGLFARITLIHQVLCLAFFLAALRVFPDRGFNQLILPHLLGIVLSVALLAALFGVVGRKSLKALTCLGVVLWIDVVKILVVQLWLLANGDIELTTYIRGMLINELIAIPLAVYWSRPVHAMYLASLNRRSAASAT
jgi:hypothetical protein